MRATRRHTPNLDAIGPDHPIRLETAAQLAFPDGSMTASGLRREKQRGRLKTERIAGRDYTTLNDIKEMRALCREERREHASTCANVSDAPPFGSSWTEKTKSARAAALTIAEGLKNSSKRILPESTARHGEAATLPT
jgi:hypothetical protein